MTTLPTLTAATTQLVVSRTADADLARLGVCPGDDKFRDRRRIAVDSIRRSAAPLDECRETQFLAKSTIDGQDVVLLCITFEGSTLGDQAQTCIVRGVFTQQRAFELMAVGKGLAPFAKECGRSAGKSTKEERNDCCETITG
ncbi:hypothetical protein [Lacipirellula parvula]|uniref:Uncharacterized protein n=1 Tax=Lacipirellula parvula TaxID=2650471 RepID=A0A5K7X7H6_9BACT|nr:hypothetical protein [Lacipirellula parvula]BBO32508.1 hypothetical protein PLANPX_2120 [Lacipirellula parvula]